MAIRFIILVGYRVGQVTSNAKFTGLNLAPICTRRKWQIKFFMLSFVMVNVLMLSVIMTNAPIGECRNV